jgi:hypothetical protein
VTTEVGGTTTTVSAEGRCAYTVSYPGDPITFVNYGDGYAPFDAVVPQTFIKNSNVCSFESIGGSFGVAAAEIQNVTGYCNTDSSGYWSNVAITDTALATGTTEYTGAFGTWVQSTISGSPFFWSWEACEEDPLGQHTTYACGYGNLGPLL